MESLYGNPATLVGGHIARQNQLRSDQSAAQAIGAASDEPDAIRTLFPLESLLEPADSHVEDARLGDALIVWADEGHIVGRQFE